MKNITIPLVTVSNFAFPILDATKRFIPKGGVITSTITNEAVKELELEVGSEATAVIKATSVILSTNPKGLSARNKLTGKVLSINEGAVNSVVKVQLDCEQVLSSTVTVEAVELSEGADVTAIIKATEVMLMA